jgi:soluble lytic murein transglycosylase
VHDSLPRAATAALTFALILLPVPSDRVAESQGQLTPTAHEALPDDPSEYWLVPTGRDRAAQNHTRYEPLAEAAARYAEGNYDAALQLASTPALAKTPLAGYASYYKGLAQLRLLRTAEARRTLNALLEQKPTGALALSARLAAGEAAEAATDHQAALAIYERLAADKTLVSADVLERLGRTALAAGEHPKAAQAYVRLYYEFPLTSAGASAIPQMTALTDHITRRGYDADLGRAQMFFGAGRYAEARAAFADIRPHMRGDERELVDLRIAESDFHLGRHAAARDALLPYTREAKRLAEARFFYSSAVRALGDHDRYVTLARALVADFPDSSWAEETLNNLGTHYILVNEDAQASEVFKELYAKFPAGTHAERAAWKYGWWSYKTGDHAETIRVFESAAATFPRSNYRPSFLYWTGRAHSKSGSPADGIARMRLVHADYANSYYGRLAERHLRRVGSLQGEDRPVHASQDGPASLPAVANEETIRLLLAIGLYDDAIGELRHAERVDGRSPAIEATIAWAYHRKGELRRAITLMRRAYPQFMSVAGSQLPAEILQVIFPLTYWPSIQREAKVHGLDPYLIAALIAQESTFDPKIRSAANAWGLMQVLPSTGRRVARQMGMRFTNATLTTAEANLKIGTYYFAGLVKQFGGTHYALASYNAGENRVVRWKRERPGIEQDEFIDDIPFPETQNYVKRILGTAEDYRMLYGPGGEGRPQPVVPK